MQQRFRQIFCCLGLLIICSFSGVNEPNKVFDKKEVSQEIALKWAKMTLEFINLQPNKTPTFISRSLGYVGLTMYESVVNGSSDYKSIALQLNGLGTLPKPEAGKMYDWETVLNSSQSKIIRLIWQPLKMRYVNPYSVKKLDSLETAILNERIMAVNDTGIINRSKNYGNLLAQKIYEWSMTDGGHEMNYKNFDPEYTYPTGENYWTPPVGGQSPVMMPLHPYWGKNRTFLKTNELPIATMIPYSKDTNSAYYKQFKQVYDIQKSLTQEQKEIANWWGDDPSATTAPPGHSFHLAINILKIKKVNLVVSAMTFAKVGIASADAFINCWRNKYTYHSERPTNYIRLNIDKNFKQYWPEPPFPGFPSGHSTQMSATTEVLINIFGDNVHFMDDTHEGRPKDYLRNVEYKNRRFEKISQVAQECGISRLYGGIHTMQDNLVGLEQGKKIGENINKIKWR